MGKAWESGASLSLLAQLRRRQRVLVCVHSCLLDSDTAWTSAPFTWPQTSCVCGYASGVDYLVWSSLQRCERDEPHSETRIVTCPGFHEPWCAPGAAFCTGCLSPRPWLSARTSSISHPLQWLWLYPWDTCVFIFLTKKKKKIKCNLTPHSAILGSWVQCTCICYFSSKFWGISAFKPRCQATLL